MDGWVALRQWRPRPLRLILLLGLLWLLGSGATVFKAASDAREGIAAARSAEELLSPADLVRGRALRHLTRAQQMFARTERGLNSPLIAPLKVLPVMGRQLRSAGALAGAAAEVSGAGQRAVRQGRQALNADRSNGAQRVALLRKLASAADDAEKSLASVDLGPRRALVAPLGKKRAEIVEQIAEARQALAKGRVVAGGLADLLEGPRRYLLLGANNAEMRAGSGMFLSIGQLSFAGGEMTLDAFTPTHDLVLGAGIAPPVADADLAARWGWLNPNRDWRNLAASPRFPASAELASTMWTARGGAPIDGVLVLDPVALRALLLSTGTTRVAGRTISAENVLNLLLHEQYENIDSSTDPDQAARQELLALVAQAALTAVQQGEADVATLVTALGRAASGRHILAWAPDRSAQRLWETAGVDGAIGQRSLAVSVLNRGANKLDPYLHVESRLVLRRSGSSTDVELHVDLRNRTPEGRSRYVLGGGAVTGVGPGDYLGLLSVNLPGAATAVNIDGDPPLAAAGPDGPTLVVAWPVRVDNGGSAAYVVRFRLPGRHGNVLVEPSARVPEVRWKAGGTSWVTGSRREVSW